MTNAVDNNPFAALGLAHEEEKPKRADQKLDQEDFFKLMIAQLQHQDPFKPEDNSEFIAQMAQFSSLEGIEQLNKTVGGFEDALQAAQMMQASTMVGQAAIVKGNTVRMYHNQDEEGNVTPSGVLGAVDIPSGASEVTVDILSENGQVVHTVNVRLDGEERPTFAWDGIMADGTVAPEGRYRFEANANVDGKNTAAQTYAGAVISSVGVTKDGPELELDGASKARLSDIIKLIG